jgi:hypothetical protein
LTPVLSLCISADKFLAHQYISLEFFWTKHFVHTNKKFDLNVCTMWQYVSISKAPQLESCIWLGSNHTIVHYNATIVKIYNTSALCVFKA